MTLEQLLKNSKTQFEPRGPLDFEITGLCQDSRRFKKGDLFVAVKGATFDGHSFLKEACRNGASAVAVEDDSEIPGSYPGTILVVRSTKKFLQEVAPEYFGHPARKLFVVGVTGTNGKTTTTHIIEAVLKAGGILTGVIGTIDHHLGDKKYPSLNTTPDAFDLQELLAEWVKEGAQALSMEVSSHALALGRVDSLDFDCAVFTNLTRDHLDFHKTMEDYQRAKARLFRDLLDYSVKKNTRAIINSDESSSKNMIPRKAATWGYGLSEGDIHASDVQLTFQGTKFLAHTPQGDFQVSLKLIGAHNVMNALAAIGVGLQAGVDQNKIAEALNEIHGVRGRLEPVVIPELGSEKYPHIFVDYAHSDDALKNVLQFLVSLREKTHTSSSVNSIPRLITVFGCGGDRDKGKRPLMMKVAREYSDLVVVTSDNPRTENPDLIIKDILSETPKQDVAWKKGIRVEVDRRAAIKLAIEEAHPGDVVLIAGKGHENYQIIGTTKHPFDDVQIAREVLTLHNPESSLSK